MLLFHNFPILFVLDPDFRHSWLGATSIFATFSGDFITLSSWLISVCLVQQLSKVWALIFNGKLNSKFNLMQVFVLELQIVE